MKIKSSQKGEITLSFNDEGKSFHSRDFFLLQICLLVLFGKIRFSRKFLNLQCPLVKTYSNSILF